MSVNITVDAACQWAANLWVVQTMPQVSDSKKERVLPIAKYNCLAGAFNASTVLLVAAVASAILLSPAFAVVYGTIALAVRMTVEQELNRYSLPVGTEPNPVMGVLYRLITPDGTPREDYICQKVGTNRPKGWAENEVNIFGYSLWKNMLPTTI